MKLYLQLITGEARDAVHGVDYTKGLDDGRECGRRHEFQTRGCKPVFFTEEEVAGAYNPDEYVEIVPFGRIEEEPTEYSYTPPMP